MRLEQQNEQRNGHHHHPGPSTNFEIRKTIVAIAVTPHGPVTVALRFQCAALPSASAPHARLGQGEADEHPDGEERDERVGVHGPPQQCGRDDAEGQTPC